MLKVQYSAKFKKDYKKATNRGYDMQKLANIIELLAMCKSLPMQNKDHSLTGNYKDFRECHIEPDWLLIYEINNELLTLFLMRTGTHSDLF